MARYCRALDPKRLKLTTEQKAERKIRVALNLAAKGLDPSVCRCPEADEGEHECKAVQYLDELQVRQQQQQHRALYGWKGW